MNGTLKFLMWTGCFLVACALAVAVRLEYVHRNTGEYRMRPSADPQILRYHGHYYHRVRQDPHRMAGFVKGAEDLGGGYFFSPADATGLPVSGAPSVIQVHDGGHYYGYRLDG